MKRCIEITICVLIIGTVGFLGWQAAFEPRFKNQASKEALKEMHENLRLGDSRQRVAELYDQFKTDRTRFRKDADIKVWDIGMPFELGSSDWILYLEFDDSDRLSAVLIRTSDGIFQRPPDSPEDKGKFALATTHENDG